MYLDRSVDNFTINNYFVFVNFVTHILTKINVNLTEGILVGEGEGILVGEGEGPPAASVGEGEGEGPPAASAYA
jgi:hypothetical protein